MTPVIPSASPPSKLHHRRCDARLPVLGPFFTLRKALLGAASAAGGLSPCAAQTRDPARMHARLPACPHALATVGDA